MGAQLSGVAGGIGQDMQREREEGMVRDQQQREREGNVFKALLASPDAHVRTMAILGMGQKPPTSKGMKGFLGIPTQHPMLDALTEYSKGEPPVPEGAPPDPSTLPSRQTVPGSTAEGDQVPLASRQTVQQTAPPISGAPSAAMAPTAVTGASAGPPPVPRSLLAAPAEQAGATAEAQAKGRIRGTLEGAGAAGLGTAGTGDPDTDEFLTRMGILKPRPTPSFQGNVTWEQATPEERASFPQGQPGQPFRREYDPLRRTSRLVPISPEATVRPTLRETAGPSGAPEYSYLSPNAPPRPTGAAPPIKLTDEKVTDTTGAEHITRITPGFVTPAGAPPAPAGSQGGGKGGDKSPAQGSQLGGPPPVPGAGRQPAAGATQAGPARPAGGVLQTRPGLRQTPGKLEEKAGAVIDAQGNVSEKTALFDPNKGQYIDPLTQKEMPNFVPGKVGDGMITTLAQTQSTNTLIDRALAALASIKNDNTLQGTLNFAAKYRGGTSGGDPVGAAQAALSDLAGLQASNSAALKGSSRAAQFVVDKRQHVPILPSPREAANGFIPPGMKVWLGQTVENAPAWDSPASMYQKLLLAKTNNLSFINEVKSGLGKAAGAIPAGGASTAAPHPNSSLPDGSPFTGPDGKTYIKTGTSPDGSVRGRPAP